VVGGVTHCKLPNSVPRSHCNVRCHSGAVGARVHQILALVELVLNHEQGQLRVNHTVHQLVLPLLQLEIACIVAVQLIVSCHSGHLGGAAPRIVALALK